MLNPGAQAACLLRLNPNPAAQASGLLRFSILFSLTSIIVAYTSITGAFAESGGDSATIVLHFPTAYSVGTLALKPFALSGVKPQDFRDARADVVIPAGAKVGLSLNFAGANDTSFLRHLPAPYLVSLELNKLGVDDEQAKNFKDLVALRNLNIEGTDIGDSGMQYFGDMKELKSLTISRTMITGKSFALLPRYPKLDSLNAAHNKLDDRSCAYLEALKSLDNLRLGGCGFGDEALVHIGKLTTLRFLHLERNRTITDAGIAHLSNLKALQYLDISETKVTGACAKYLKAMTRLDDLYLSLRKLSPREIAAFHAAVPHCQIHDIRSTDNPPLELFGPLHSPMPRSSTVP